MKTKIHAIAGIIAFLTILIFWTSTVISELFGTYENVLMVKSMILKGMFILVPAMIIVGASGMNLGQHRKDATTLAKKKRMPIIAANGLIILLPAAYFLQSKAEIGSFNNVFYGLQALELVAGAINITLMGLNIRDGRAMTLRKRQMKR